MKENEFSAMDAALAAERNQLDEDDEIIYVSKSEIKRDAEQLKKLGVELIQLTKHELSSIPMDETLRHHVELAQKLTREGARRQMQFVGKLLRSRDLEPITTALDKLKNRHNQQKMGILLCERLRDALIESGDPEPIMGRYPSADRQYLRQLARSAKKAEAAGKSSTASRQIFIYLKSLQEECSF